MGEKRWIETEEKMISELEMLRDKMYTVPKADEKTVILCLIIEPLKQSMEKLQRIIIEY